MKIVTKGVEGGSKIWHFCGDVKMPNFTNYMTD